MIMENAGTLLALVLQGLTQMQTYAGTVQKALAEGRDVSLDELKQASGGLQAHLDSFQAKINAKEA
jgi:hypothetical protein